MRTLNLADSQPTIEQILSWAEDETVLIQARSGSEFVVATLEDVEFHREVASLRHNEEFIAFLDARAKEPTVSLAEARKMLLDAE
jgi:hypothetical protein